MPDAGRTASAGARAGREPARPRGRRPARSSSSPTASIPRDIAAFPAGGSARAALIVAPDGGGAEVADWSRRADVATVAGQHRRRRRPRRRSGRWPPASPAPPRPRAASRTTAGCWRSRPALLVLLWFRRGTTLRWGAMLLGLALLARRAARGADGLADWFWTPDQQGRRLYEAHDYPEAAAAFADPEWRAAALFRAGKYAEAAELLAPIQTSVGAVQPRHGARPRPRLPGRRGRLRGGARSSTRRTRRRAQPRRDEADHRLPDRGPAGRGPGEQAETARRHRRRPDRRPGQARPHRRRLAALRGRRRRMDALGRDQARRLPQVPLRHRGGEASDPRARRHSSLLLAPRPRCRAGGAAGRGRPRSRRPGHRRHPGRGDGDLLVPTYMPRAAGLAGPRRSPTRSPACPSAPPTRSPGASASESWSGVARTWEIVPQRAGRLRPRRSRRSTVT